MVSSIAEIRAYRVALCGREEKFGTSKNGDFSFPLKFEKTFSGGGREQVSYLRIAVRKDPEACG